jgi:hypothetical protein
LTAASVNHGRIRDSPGLFLRPGQRKSRAEIVRPDNQGEDGMPTREIPRHEWELFFNTFSGQYEGWLVSIDVDDNQKLDQVEAHNLSLEGITADMKDREDTISISVGHTPDKRMTHAVAQPTRVLLEQSTDGTDKEIRIESREGTTRLRLRAPIHRNAPGE